MNHASVPLTINLDTIDSESALAAAVSSAVSKSLTDYGALRFETNYLKNVDDFEALLTSMGCELMRYEFASTPRRQLKGNVYSSTEYPADQEIFLHNEMAYTTIWPNRLWFFCETAPESGGETPIADSRRIYQKLDQAITRTFEEKGLLYVRNYRPGLDLPWQQVFGTDDERVVEQMCRRMGVTCEWSGEELRTRQRCHGAAIHPATNEPVWFNQAHLFHVSNLPTEYRELLSSMYSEDELPRNVLFGDGTRIDHAMLAEVRHVMSGEKRKFAWQTGDVLVLDNLIFAHGREPFVGPRKIAVAME